ncbi:hydantoinase B/oxoprolinase family protein [Gordonia sp. LSe1-13]|uniref:Hydantoinase B/oxoprolinase family protein n=1 Tax=Gordonia sesuvii TaxID=3116777 RepID=A0ABU7MIZ4_9ACTN|nr:hydantoinase B/oxoprolinase family protein [Gordonia sp. LSe1-13]
MTTIAPESDVLLRDLSETQFAELYGADRFTMTVLSGRMRYIVEHMCGQLLNNTFSAILRDWYDFAATVHGPAELDYPMCSVSNSLAAFFGTMCDGVRNALEEYGPERLNPGDVLICNDPYRTGTHVNDVLFVRPVFSDGNIISFVSLRAHQMDMGGIVPAGFSSTKRDVYETGLVVSPQLLYAAGEPVMSVFNLFLDNARYGAMVMPDITTIRQNLDLAERLITETAERYGVPALLGSMRYACDMSAESMATALRSLPDGEYSSSGYIDADSIDDTEYKIVVNLKKAGDRLEVDLSGTSPQARTSINGSVLDAKTAVGVALKMLIDRDTPFTSGTYRPVDIVLPAGTIVSATPPDGAIFMFWEPCCVITAAIFDALQEALGDRAIGGDYGSLSLHNGNGTTEDGTPWVTTGQCGGEHGPWSGTQYGDGDSYQVIYLANNLDPATEAIEADLPVVVLRKEYVADSCGAGFNRGGAAVVKDTFWRRASEHWTSPLRVRDDVGFGVNGGCDGTRTGVWLFDDAEDRVVAGGGQMSLDGEVLADSTPVAGMFDSDGFDLSQDGGTFFHYGKNQIWRTRPGAVWRYRTAGAGGWGAAKTRDPQRVLRDVRNGYVTVAGAARDYGVVVIGDPEIDPEGLSVDEIATAELRSA